MANKPRAPADAPLLDAVFGSTAGRRPSGRHSSLAVGLLVAGLSHAALYVLARAKEPSLETWTANMAALIHADLANRSPTPIEAAPPTLPPKPAEPALSQPPEEPDRADTVPVLDRQKPPALKATAPSQAGEVHDKATSPGQAAQVLTAEPVDLTGDTFVVGSGHTYVGGATTSSGIGTLPLVKPQGDEQLRKVSSKPASRSLTTSRARPVQLPLGTWKCAWPQVAIAQDIYEQYVVLRVQVRPDGSVEGVTVLDDPGNGFGAAAAACARGTQFTPARDEKGDPVRATSPPIRVRFTR